MGKQQINANGPDLSFIAVKVVDKQGQSRDIRVQVQSAGLTAAQTII
jgi:hypothetical protein